MSNANTTRMSLTDEEKAFIASFKDTHSQYAFTEEVIVASLRGTSEYFDGYTQLADARNLWKDAIAFARRA
jgi:cobalamin biosynthesis Co2+ chelatase CbiK